MTKRQHALAISRETVRDLSGQALTAVDGGAPNSLGNPCAWTRGINICITQPPGCVQTTGQ